MFGSRKIVKIEARAYIYDANLLCFVKRLLLSNSRIKSLRNLFAEQNYSCHYCGLLFMPDDVIELHYAFDNMNKDTGKVRFVHGHCHDSIHSTNNSN